MLMHSVQQGLPAAECTNKGGPQPGLAWCRMGACCCTLAGGCAWVARGRWPWARRVQGRPPPLQRRFCCSQARAAAGALCISFSV